MADWTGYSALSPAVAPHLRHPGLNGRDQSFYMGYPPSSRPGTPATFSSGSPCPSSPDSFAPQTPGSSNALRAHVGIASGSPQLSHLNPYSPGVPSPLFLSASSPNPHSSAPYVSSKGTPMALSNPRFQLRPGPIVPQNPYITHFTAGTPPFEVIFRFIDSPEIGIPCRLLLNPDAMDLPMDGAHEVPFMDNIATTITLRIWWPGYVQYSRRLTIRKATGILTRVEMGMAAAECLKNFIDEARIDPAESGQEQWRVGKNRITVHDLVLLRLSQVSQGSWQMDIRLEAA